MSALSGTGQVFTLTLSLLLMLPIGCGFHLRGSGVLPGNFQQIVLDCEPVKAENLCRNIRRQLSAGGITTTSATGEDSEASDAEGLSLVIDSVRDKRRAASLAADASAAEIELSRTVEFTVKTPAQEEQPATLSATQFQTYQFTELSVLGKEKEEQQVRDNLDQLLATEILNRSASIFSASVNATE